MIDCLIMLFCVARPNLNRGASVIIPGNKNKPVQAFELYAQFQDTLFMQGQTQIINRAVTANGGRPVALINLQHSSPSREMASAGVIKAE